MKMIKLASYRFHIHNFRNLAVRLATRDKYYVCDECRTIHKRDGTELDNTPNIEHRAVWRWWYPSVCQHGYDFVMNRASEAIRDSIFGK